MSPQLKKLEDQALLLPPEDREFLAQRLFHSLDNTPLNDIDEAWIQEAEKRYKAYKEGLIKGIPGEKLFAEIRQELGWQS